MLNGKGTLYDKNGNIRYEGDYIDNKFEGNGKLIFADGHYYIGQFKNNLANGKGPYLMKMEILYMKVIILMVRERAVEN